MVIIGKEKLKNLILGMKNKKIPNYGLLPVISVAFTLLIAIVTTKEYNNILGISGNTLEIVVKTLFWVCTFYIVGVIISYLYLRQKNGKFTYDLDDLENQIIQSNQHETDDLFVLLFPKVNNNELEFLVRKKETWGNSYFCPYIEGIGKSDVSNYTDEIKRRILDKYSISIPIKILHLDNLDLSNVKLTTNDLPKTFNYRFLLILPRSSFFKNALNDELNGFEFKSISQLLDDPSTLKYNEDIVSNIKMNQAIIVKQFKENSPSNSKIVWNIDKKCSETCSFCAYGGTQLSDEVLTLEQKKLLIDSLKSININTIDIATGDNPNILELQEIIKYIKTTLKLKISLTTISLVIDQLDIGFIRQNIETIEITYDYPKGKEYTHRSNSYNLGNYSTAKKLIKAKIQVEASVVLHSNLEFKDLAEIKRDLKSIGVKRILLIRLMPVGRLSYDEYPENFLKRNTYIKTLNLNQIGSDGVKLHCSLQGVQNNNTTNRPCEMGISKLGISSDGNFYICPWGEHLTQEENPFKLGNPLDETTDVRTFLKENQAYNEILKRSDVNQPHCKIFCFLDKADMFSRSDRLYLDQ